MPYWQLYYHLVWATKGRLPRITAQVEQELYGLLRGKAVGLEAKVFVVNGVADHVHLVAAIPPKIAVATFVGQVKGVASTRFNQGHPDADLYWQDSYGAFSVDGRRLQGVIEYVERQKEHHATGSVIAVLERMED